MTSDIIFEFLKQSYLLISQDIVTTLFQPLLIIWQGTHLQSQKACYCQLEEKMQQIPKFETCF